MIPTIKTAEGKAKEENDKHIKKIAEEVGKIAKEQAKEAKKTDETLAKETKAAQPPPLKGPGDEKAKAASLA